jgi:endonuclease/exonuclease/phosphatase family metal-dependent hydrolase
MASRFRIFTRRFFIYTNIIAVLLFLLACLVPVLNPQSWWFISFLGLAFPFLLLILIIYMLVWLFTIRRFALISAIALILGLRSILVLVSFHRPSSFQYEKQPGNIRIVSWNVARFIEMKRNNNKGSQTRLKMMELLEQQDADILCLQEFFHSFDPEWYANIDYISKILKYRYWYFSHDIDADQHYSGSIIFSRYPILDSGMIRYPRPTLPDALMHADIKVNDDTLRVYTTHLQSLQFGKADYQKLRDIREADDSLLSNSKTIFSKWKKAVANRSIQADIIDKVLDDSPHPLIFCGDLNDVPNSYTYFTVKGEMQDAFLKKGFGIGRTFSAISPTLRIDYIFADQRFKIRQFNRVVKRYSDHYMIVADVELKK